MKKIVSRVAAQQHVREALAHSPIAAIFRPRQCGKTTLARQVAATWGTFHWFDLENAIDLARLEEPMLVLADLQGLIVIDEVQRLPSLFPLLRVLADRPECQVKFLLLGSAAPSLVKQASESLAERIEFIDLGGFHLGEVDDQDTLWRRGGFPKSYLSVAEQRSFTWRNNFLRTFLETDLALLGSRANTATMRRLWTMLAHYHGQTWNGSEIGRSLGLSHHTTRNYLDLLTGT